MGLSRITAIVIALSVCACGSSATVGELRFKNEAVVWKVNDRADTPKKPSERKFAKTLYHFDGFYHRALTRAMEVQPDRRSASVNSMDEVPDSTWFTNRIGMREMSVDEVRRGPNADESPELHKPWTITGTKVGGVSVGFIIKDARGVKYLLKFDVKAVPEMETAADVIVQRLFWAVGFNVPEDSIVEFTRDDLVMAEDANVKDFFGNKRPMTKNDLDDNLAKVYVSPDGTIRGLVSKFLSGVPIGGYSREGKRKDDPNDHFIHEMRREVRGQHPIFAWLLHTDVKEDNTLDMWSEDPANPDHHYVIHYLVDFGKALGTLGYLDHIQHEGFAHVIDWEYFLKSFASLGLYERPWEKVKAPKLTGIGLIESTSYDPSKYKSHAPYFALKDKDRFDAFWGSKILMRFTPEQLRAVVEEARYSDPRATDYMTRILVERQRKTARYWFNQVNPLDAFEVSKSANDTYQVCYDDLTLRYQLDAYAIDTEYDAESYDYVGDAIGWRVVAIAPGVDGRTCLSGLTPGSSNDGYTIVSIVTRRGGKNMPAAQLHMATDPATNELRIIGLRRL
jgi:hypothetical protein